MIVFGLLSLLTIVNSQFTQEHLSQLKSLTCNDPSVTVHVFSGTPNPVWKIDAKQLSQIKARADRTLSRSANLAGLNRQSTRVMGYHGFTVSCSAEESVFIHGISPLEQLLLRGGRRYLQATVARHVEEHLGDILADITQTTSSNADCNSVPIKGPDTVPKYDPNSDDSGCFVKKQSENNCYAYGKRRRCWIHHCGSLVGTDIVTNSFPQPGEKRKRFHLVIRIFLIL